MPMQAGAPPMTKNILPLNRSFRYSQFSFLPSISTFLTSSTTFPFYLLKGIYLLSSVLPAYCCSFSIFLYYGWQPEKTTRRFFAAVILPGNLSATISNSIFPLSCHGSLLTFLPIFSKFCPFPYQKCLPPLNGEKAFFFCCSLFSSPLFSLYS